MNRQQEVTARQIMDLVIALAPVAIILAIQYRDEIKRAQLWLEQRLAPKDPHAEALRQVQKEISLMEHGMAEGDA